MERRNFLTTAAVGASELGAAPPRIPPWMLRAGAAVAPYGAPSHFVADVVRRPSGVRTPSLTPLADQLGIITASGLCFVRNHAGIPSIDPAVHELYIHGRVTHPRMFSLSDILRFPSVSRICFLECSGNSAPGFEALGTGVQFSHGLLSCCEWTGVPLRTLLDEAGVEPGGAWLVAEGADAAAYDRSLPLDHILDEALVAYGQNGEMLRPEQGFPLRLIVPGFEGSANVKWLRRLKIVPAPVYAREETSKYATVDKLGNAHPFDFVMDVKSVIATPSPGRTLPAPGFYDLRGYAWSGRGTIRRVEVTVDGGATWSEASIGTPNLPKSLVRFNMPFLWDGSAALIASRATDETGAFQPKFSELAERRGNDLRYHVNAIAMWHIDRSGRVHVARV